MREKASRPRTGPCCPLAKRGGRECGDEVSYTAILALLGPGGKGNCSFIEVLGTTDPGRNRTKRKQKILHPALLRGKEWCSHHLLKSRIQRLRVARLRDAACPGASRAWQGRRRAAPVSCGQLHAAAVVQAAVVAELERRWRQQEGALGDEQTEGLQPAVGWRQQRTAGAGCVETPPSASVRRRTAGQSPPPLRRIGRPGRSGSPEACLSASYPPGQPQVALLDH